MRGTPSELLVLVAVLLACGGARDSEKVTTPRGKRGYSIECETMAECYAKAGRLCPMGYNIIDTGTRSETTALQRLGAGLQAGGAALADNPQPAPQPNSQTYMQALIECRKHAPSAATGGTKPKPTPTATTATTTTKPTTCSAPARTGLYETFSQELDGNCGPLKPELGRLRNAVPDPPSRSCSITGEVWSDDGCELTRDVTCQLPDLTLKMLARTRQNADGSILTGVNAVTLRDSRGVTVCSGTYRVTAVRQ